MSESHEILEEPWFMPIKRRPSRWELGAARDRSVFAMIRYATGNLFEADAVAFVNAVNTVGVMGKGIALMFKETFPENFEAYAGACARGEVEVGRMFVTDLGDAQGPRWIINFPTKRHWRDPSRLEWVVEGLRDLRRVIVANNIRTIAIHWRWSRPMRMDCDTRTGTSSTI
jgi:Macro domain